MKAYRPGAMGVRCTAAGSVLKSRPVQVGLEMRSDAFSPIMIAGAFVLPDTISGMIEQSATRSPPDAMYFEVRISHSVRTRSPILHVPVG